MPLRTPSAPPPPLAEDPTTAALMEAEAAGIEAARQTNLRDSDQKGGRPQPPRLKSVDDRAAVVLQTMWRGSLGRKTHDALGRTLLDKKHAAARLLQLNLRRLVVHRKERDAAAQRAITSTTTDADTNLPRALAHLISITAAIHVLLEDDPSLNKRDPNLTMGEKVDTLNSDAALYLQMGQHSDALPSFSTLLTTCTNALGPLHPVTTLARDGTLALLIELGHNDDAIVMLRHAVEDARSHLGM